MASAACSCSSPFSALPVLSPPLLDSKSPTCRSQSCAFPKSFRKVLASDPNFRITSFPLNRGSWNSLHSATSGFVVSSSQSACVQTESNPQLLVDDLLNLVEGTDRGTLLGDQEQSRVEEIISKLEQYCIPEPLQSPLIFGEWDVVFTSNQTATGGYFRSAIGRTFLKTKQMVQSIKAPDFVGNSVAFSLLNLLPGEVSLKGKLQPVDKRWIEIAFDSPHLKLGSLEFQYGKLSNVKIAIIYVDERIRLGRGSRGSLFVFKRR